MGTRCAVLPGGRAALAALVERRGLLRGMGSFVRRACGLLWSRNAQSADGNVVRGLPGGRDARFARRARCAVCPAGAVRGLPGRRGARFARRACGLLLSGNARGFRGWTRDARFARRAGCSGSACMAAGFTARHGFICPAGLRPALEREWAGRRWARGARFCPAGGLLRAALVWRRVLLRAAWGHLSGGLAACFGAGMRERFRGLARDARFCPACGLLRAALVQQWGLLRGMGSFVRRACGNRKIAGRLL